MAAPPGPCRWPMMPRHEKRVGRQRAPRTWSRTTPSPASAAIWRLRVYTSRLLGREKRLVLHGGGNTSLKTRLPDLLGEETEVLCVKGSGWDLAAIEPAGLPAVRLAPLRTLSDARAPERRGHGAHAARQSARPGAPNPSVETLLHAFLPHRYVDHTHATAVLSITDQPDGAARCAELYGGRMAVLPYIMPGFDLARKAAEVYEADPSVDGPGAGEARRLHLRRGRARGLRAHDRSGKPRRRAAGASAQCRVRARAICHRASRG